MITIPVINGSPQTPIPKPNFGVFCNGQNYYVAESLNEPAWLAVFPDQTANRLATAKQEKKNNINSKSKYLIEVIGYSFDGYKFPFDDFAQRNFAGLRGEIESGVVTESDFPKDIYRYNNEGETGDKYYSLSWANFNLIRRAHYERVNTVRNEGITLIQQIDAAQTIEQVNAITDNRT